MKRKKKILQERKKYRVNVLLKTKPSDSIESKEVTKVPRKRKMGRIKLIDRERRKYDLLRQKLSISHDNLIDELHKAKTSEEKNKLVSIRDSILNERFKQLKKDKKETF